MLTHLNLSSCTSLTELCFKSISQLKELSFLNMSGFEGSMSTLWLLGGLNLQ